MIGDAGLTPSVLREIDNALRTHELIKVRVFGDDRDARATMYAQMCEELGAAPVQSIGKLVVLFRPKPEEGKQAKPKTRKPAGPRKSKKQLAAQTARRK